MHLGDMMLITPAEAEALILSSIAPLSNERVSLERSLGRVLREPILADRSFPPFDRVTMDGIAFFKSDLNKLRLHGLHAAGDPEPAELPAGSCWQIMTGASLPSDCDTVVPYEEVEIGETHAKINCEVVPGRFIHRKESDASPGDLLVPAGTRIGPAQLGLAASVGAIELTVTRLPKITILGTGDELVPPEETPLPHQLRQSNGLTLRAAVEEWGAA
ncbi:molybdopterin molybdotransferase MoeA, partial [Akkermansiaceae bacterium]|nr:molybdopterin molybdotransferase MoeA [Akkermansiaceae bacterium]